MPRPTPEPRDAFGRRLSVPRHNVPVLEIQREKPVHVRDLELITDDFLNEVKDLAFARAYEELKDNIVDEDEAADAICTRAITLYNRMLDRVRIRTA
jgi:hypothetical protein